MEKQTVIEWNDASAEKPNTVLQIMIVVKSKRVIGSLDIRTGCFSHGEYWDEKGPIEEARIVAWAHWPRIKPT